MSECQKQRHAYSVCLTVERASGTQRRGGTYMRTKILGIKNLCHPQHAATAAITAPTAIIFLSHLCSAITVPQFTVTPLDLISL